MVPYCLVKLMSRQVVVLAAVSSVFSLTPAIGTCAAVGDALKPVSLMDSVTSQDIDSVLMRPDGAVVAYVAHKADLSTNKNLYTLSVVSTRGSGHRELLSAEKLSDVVWAGDGHTLYGLAERDGHTVIVKADSDTGAASDVWSGDEKINKLAVAADGTVVFSTAVQADAETFRRRKEEGLVYEWGRDSALDIVNRNYTLGDWEDFHIVEPNAKSSHLLYRLKYDGAGRHLPFVLEMKFSPDSRRLAFVVSRRGSPAKGGGAFDFDVAVLDVESAQLTELQPGSVLSERGIAWAADSRHLLFIQNGAVKLYDLLTHSLDPLPWAKFEEPNAYAPDFVYDSPKKVAYARTRVASYTFDFKRRTVKRIPHSASMVADASFDRAFRMYAFIDQALERRPEVAVYDPGVKATRRLTDLNPWIDQRTFGKVEKLEVVNASGLKSAAYLVYPVGYDTHVRYPLIIGTYGFVGKFILNAEWHTTFPAQALAGQGYAVLLLNAASSGQSVANDPVKARDLEGWQVMATFDRAAQMMVSQGVADPDRIGIYGWSYGAFLVQFMLAHSQTPLKAAAMGEGGDYNPSEYGAFGMTSWPQIFQNMYGGPLSAKTSKAYTDFAPVLSVENFKAPLLMEFSGRDGYFGLEMYVPLRVLKVPAELVTYDDEPHNFVTPRARLASMARKVDWFNYWMLDKTDPDASKSEQYTRWRGLRDQWQAARGVVTSPP